MTDPVAKFRQRNAGKTITWLFPGEIIEDTDGTPIGMTENITSTEVIPPETDE